MKRARKGPFSYRSLLCDASHNSFLNQGPAIVLVNNVLSQCFEKAQFVVSITHTQLVSDIMWLPAPVYERIPQFWFLLGLLFIAAGLYLGFEYVLSFYYCALGGLCCVYGLAIFLMRLNYRQNRPVAEQTSEAGE